jgi:hypothetical protein
MRPFSDRESDRIAVVSDSFVKRLTPVAVVASTFERFTCNAKNIEWK